MREFDEVAYERVEYARLMALRSLCAYKKDESMEIDYIHARNKYLKRLKKFQNAESHQYGWESDFMHIPGSYRDSLL